MGRVLKRVPLNFNWPTKKIWGGYINPFYRQKIDCPKCDGSGYSPEAKRLQDLWYGYIPFKPEDRGSIPFTPDHPIVRKLAERNVKFDKDLYTSHEMVIREADRLCKLFNSEWMHHLNQDDVDALVKAGRLHDFTHTWADNKWQLKDPPYTPTAKEVNEWSLVGFSHDGCNESVCVDSECFNLGFTTECFLCHGSGELWPTPEIKKQAEEWEETDPPVGEGFQLWETTSEGSPVSPVFSTLKELCDWSAENATVFADHKATSEEWMAMFDKDFIYHQEGQMIFI